MNDLIINHIAELILPKSTDKPLKGKELDELNVVKNGAVVIKDGRIVYAGPHTDDYDAAETIDASGKVVSPALVDAHTHLTFGGSREHEMSLKRQGKSYLEILEMGGGILSTVNATRETSEEDLFKKAEHDLLTMIKHGVLAVESKSGYGLDRENELKQLKVSNRLAEKYDLDMKHTFLGPHAVPKEASSNEAFLEEMIALLPEVKQYADFADIFCETGVFTIKQSQYYMQKAKETGFKVKIHADEIDPLGGLELAIDEQAISADHLVASSNKGKEKLRNSDTVAVLLPATTLVMAIAALKLKLSPNEVWNAVTVNAAKAIDLDAGTINTGDKANLVIWDAPNHEYIPYHFGINHAEKVIKDGKVIVDNTLSFKA
ncbi:amidohydrolase family protein [Staphylococcus aureus]